MSILFAVRESEYQKLHTRWNNKKRCATFNEPGLHPACLSLPTTHNCASTKNRQQSFILATLIISHSVTFHLMKSLLQRTESLLAGSHSLKGTHVSLGQMRRKMNRSKTSQRAEGDSVWCTLVYESRESVGFWGLGFGSGKPNGWAVAS